MKRLKCLLLSNNRISKIENDLQMNLPNLEALILTNNQIQEIADLDPLMSIKTLKYLSLLDNPVTTKKHYRYYVLHKCPSIRILDFRRVQKKVNRRSLSFFILFTYLFIFTLEMMMILFFFLPFILLPLKMNYILIFEIF